MTSLLVPRIFFARSRIKMPKYQNTHTTLHSPSHRMLLSTGPRSLLRGNAVRLVHKNLSRMAASSSSSSSSTPVEDSIRSKLTTSLSPTHLSIHNDSHLHSHHRAMRDSTSQETHFRVNVVSEEFAGQRQPARHRVVYTLLKEELERDGGIHALQLKTKTPTEWKVESAKHGE